jgi:SNF2 family DNA or RNA helicase
MAIRLICPDTIEEKILLLQAGKKELIDDLIKVDSNAVKSLSKDDLLNLLD